MTTGQGTSAYDELAAAAGKARMIFQRVGGDGGVLDQIAAGGWTSQLSDASATDLAALIRAMSEHVRATRASGGGMDSNVDPVTRSSPVTEMLDRALPLNRKERFYTGTVLPMLVASDGFAHINRFLSLCGVPAAIESSRDGNQALEFFTEYSFVESVFTERDRARFPESPVDNDTPDIVLVGDDWLLAVEAKMFHNPSVVSLSEQMQRQRVIVDYVAGILGLEDDRVRHVLLIPEQLPAEGVHVSVVTWQEVLSAYRVVGPSYWVNVLNEALRRYDDLASRATSFGQYRDATLTGAEILTEHQAGSLAYEYMGRFRGLEGPDLARDIAEGSWRSRNYEVRVEPLNARNWFPVASFIERVQS